MEGREALCVEAVFSVDGDHLFWKRLWTLSDLKEVQLSSKSRKLFGDSNKK